MDGPMRMVAGEPQVLHIVEPPTPAGYWIWPDLQTRMAGYRRPSAWHRFWYRVLLGWRWEDGS